MKLVFILQMILLLWAYPLWGGTPLLNGQVSRVIDGDTLSLVDPKGVKTKVRLYGIDAPERNQPYGEQSTKALKNIAEGREAAVTIMDIDRYGRVVGIVHVNGEDMGKELISSGLAWVYPQYCKVTICDGYRRAGLQAKSAQLGLWGKPVPPWEFRRKKK